MPKYTFHHIHLISPDPEKTADFYRSVFNAELVSEQPLPDGRTMIQLSLDETPLYIMQPAAGETITPAASPTGLDHLGLMTDDLDATMADLKAHGATIRDDIIEIFPGVRILFFWGPENVLVELIEVKSNQ